MRQTAVLAPGGKTKWARLRSRILKYRAFYLMLLPALVYYIVFRYIPMYGIKISFFEYGIFGQGAFIGLENFRRIFTNKRFLQAFRNTIILSGLNLAWGMVLTIAFALLLNEIRTGVFKKVVQTVAYLPHFLSWVVVASIFTMILSPETGVVNAIIEKLGGKSVYFLISDKWWRSIFVGISRWKDTGWGTIIYLAALSNIDPQLYESASIDGASRLKQTWYITLPGLRTTILIVLIMKLSHILNIFIAVFVLYNPLVYSVADVIGTYTYRVGLVHADYDYSTAVGLFKSLISMVLVLMANRASKQIQGESIL